VMDSIPPVFYVPYRQDDELGFAYFYARTSLDPDQLITTVRATVKRLDPNLPVEDLKTMEQQVRENVFLDRMISTMSASFAVLATLLAAVGLYGVLAYTVAQRTREIGLRMALGADGRRVRALVLKQVAFMTAVGGVLGIAGALGIGKVAGSMLYGLKGNDPLVFALSAALLTAVALGAGFVPALRASKVDPMQALRYE
jgi:ABC-type antimicrobial peptide transport system permease subunit